MFRPVALKLLTMKSNLTSIQMPFALVIRLSIWVIRMPV